MDKLHLCTEMLQTLPIDVSLVFVNRASLHQMCSATNDGLRAQRTLAIFILFYAMFR